jgi:predicted transposase/invertase (TIGR01784 family)
MWDLNALKQTKVYQEAKEEGRLEGKLEIVPLLLSLGASVEQISETLGLDLEAVRQAVQQQPSSD